MIIGPVGSGKSTFLKGILSETPLSRGFVYARSNQSVAFADQESWIQNSTIRDAIRGPDSRDISSWDDLWYQEVVSCCGLAEDLEALPRGDNTLIGSKGISLSGGQKQRLALARAVYSKADLLVLDDVFSGLDNDTEELIFRRLFGRSGPLKRLRTTVVMVTHAVHRLTYADLIVSLDASGCVAEQGSYASLINSNGYVHGLDVRFKTEERQMPETETADDTLEATKRIEKTPAAPTAVSNIIENDDENVQNLKRRTGDWSTYKHWFKSCGYLSSTLSLTWAFLWVLSTNAPGVLVRFFSGGGSGADAKETTFIAIFGATTALAALAVGLLGYQVFMHMQPRSSSHLHLDLLNAVLDAPLSFFTRTDLGTVINRFSQDMALVDTDLPFSYADFTLSLASCVVGIALMTVSGSGYFAAVVPVALAALYAIQKFYLRTSRQLRLLDLEEKAPLYTLFGETASGLASVRAFGWTDKFADRNLELLDKSQRPFYLLYCVQRWLGIVLDLLVTVLVTVLMVVIVAKRASIQPGVVGLGLLSTVDLSSSLTTLIKTWTNLETSIGAISRLKDFVATTESEHKPQEVDAVGKRWPENGEVEFVDFDASYSADSALVLKKVDLDIRPTEKVGVCGRSGSGKSSMLASLLHLLEFRSGQIKIDGVDISRIPRETLRARINVIPQEPFWVTTETVRFNMDPWRYAEASREAEPDSSSRSSDSVLIAALTECRIWPVVEARGGLDAVMAAEFLSHGQRQLFCLARALVRGGRVVVLDEVSANVDVETDRVMQRVIRTRFKGCTVVAVAHRLNTIDDGDRVVVLSQGRVVEAGEPQTLLNTRGSRFKELYEA
jgi:ABC-type multidrug transport system fused ATPase/permease subunit